MKIPKNNKNFTLSTQKISTLHHMKLAPISRIGNNIKPLRKYNQVSILTIVILTIKWIIIS